MPAQVADAVAVRVHERARVDLVDRCRAATTRGRSRRTARDRRVPASRRRAGPARTPGRTPPAAARRPRRTAHRAASRRSAGPRSTTAARQSRPVGRREQRLRRRDELEVRAEVDEQQPVVARVAEEAQHEGLGRRAPRRRSRSARCAARRGSSRRSRSRSRCSAYAGAWRSRSARSSLQRSNVVGLAGSSSALGVARRSPRATGTGARNSRAAPAHRARRAPARGRRSRGTGAEAANSCPWKSIGVPRREQQERRQRPQAAGAGQLRAAARRARELATWSWFCEEGDELRRRRGRAPACRGASSASV